MKPQNYSRLSLRERILTRTMNHNCFRGAKADNPARSTGRTRPWSHLPGRVFGFGGARGGEPQVAEFQTQRLPGDSQEQGGLMLTSPSVL